MFTGIIEELGTVERLERGEDAARLTVRAPLVMEGTRPGDSIAVNGCCLTVARIHENGFTADLMAETLRRTGLGELTAGSPVNLERALRPSDRMGGHFVQGHVDATARVLERQHEERWDLVRVYVPEHLLRYIAVKGSVAIDGVSLTVVEVVDDPGSLLVSLIPETLRRTTLGIRRPGETVNLEVDIMAKHLERLVGADRREQR